MKQRFRNFQFSFPVQLLVVHLKHNQVLVLFWILLFGFITRTIGKDLGIPYLFLDPEYLGRVDFISYLILGFSFGAFVMAFQIASYLVNSYRFPFLATLSRPFVKYTINNSLIPLAFVILFCIRTFHFQLRNEFTSVGLIILNLSGFLLGATIFYSLSLTYFFTVSKDIFRLFGIDITKKNRLRLRRVQLHKSNWTRVSHRYYPSGAVQVSNYFSHPFKIRLTRDSAHYDPEVIERVFRQNHLVAALFELAVVAVILLLAFLRDYPAMVLPAGASLFLIFTMLLMLASAFHTWLRGWSFTLFIVLLVGINYLSSVASFGKRSEAFGLDYDTEISPVPDSLLFSAKRKELAREDSLKGIRTLINWKNQAWKDKNGKPVIVFLNVSGGGMKAAMWTVHALQNADKACGGKLLPNVHLITGSSGGMIGAAYLRELLYRQKLGLLDNLYAPGYANDMGKDILNPVGFSLAVSDVFFRLQKVEFSGNYYTRDRGYEFEKALNVNTGYRMDRKLIDYAWAEAAGMIPTMIFSPTVINDGRRILISSRPLSFLTGTFENGQNEAFPTLPEDIEFSRYFAAYGADKLRFTSAIRMNATFPYILPAVALPGKPKMEVMDAGFRDNYGIKTSIRYLFNFKDWIAENCATVVILRLRENYPAGELRKKENITLLKSALLPLGNVYENLFRIQGYQNEQLLLYAKEWYKGSLNVVEMDLNPSSRPAEDMISMSLHLTSLEKERVRDAITARENQEAIEKLRRLLE